MANEMLDFGNGVIGLALNLEETEVGAIILGDYLGIAEGTEVRTTGKLLSVPVARGCLAAWWIALAAGGWQGSDQAGRVLSGRENRSRHHQAQIREPAGADGHHGD